LRRPADAALEQVGRRGDHGAARRDGNAVRADPRRRGVRGAARVAQPGDGALVRRAGSRLHRRDDLRAAGIRRTGRAAPSPIGRPALNGVSLRCQDIEVAFGGLRAVDGVSYEFEPNRLYSLIGPNGAGKTTLMNALSGRSRLNNGKVLL